MRINIIKTAIIFFSTPLKYLSGLLLLFVLLPLTHVQSQPTINGFFQNYNAIKTTPDYDFIAARNRFRLEFSQSVDIGNLYSELDLIQRYEQSQSVEVLLRELYVDWYRDKSDIRIGLQKINWGRSNGAFVTDILSPVDLREFLTQDPADLTLGITALSYTRYFGSNSLQLIFNPINQRDLLPDQNSRWFPLQSIDGPLQINFDIEQQPNRISEVQLAAAFRFRNLQNLDLDIFSFYWSHPSPAYGVTVNLLNFPNPPSVLLTESYDASPMAGYSAEYRLGRNFIIQSEFLYVHQKPFTFLPVSVNRLENAIGNLGAALSLLQDFEIRDDGYLLSKPWTHYMIGFQTELWGVTVNSQAYLETILNYEERILPQQYFPYLTMFMSRSVLRDRLQLFSLGRYNIYGEDFWFQLQGIYEVSDGFEFALGTNLFGGNQISPFYGHFTFNQFKDNSFIFSRITLFF